MAAEPAPTDLSDTPPTLADWLEEWLASLHTRVEPTTWAGYDRMVRYYLTPRLGHLRLDQLTVRVLEAHYGRLLAGGGRRGGRLSRRTVALAHGVLHVCLADAVRLGVLDDNVAAAVAVPRVDPHADRGPSHVHAWSAEQVRTFLELTADHELADLWRVALGTGMRRGELLGLRWQDVDLSVPQVQVAASLAHVHGRLRLKTTKTRRIRTLHLDEATAAAIDRQPRRAPDPYPVVFTRPDGSPWRPEVVTDRWRRLARRLDLPRLRLHDLRHTHATLLLQAGVPIKVVSERLGHATIAMTMDTYAHVLPAMDRGAAAAYEGLLAGPVDGSG